MSVPNEEEVRAQIGTLKAPIFPWPAAEKYYGIKASDPAINRIQRWCNGRSVPTTLASEDGLDRRMFEQFLQTNQLLTRKWAAAELAMEVASFDMVIEKLANDGPFLPTGQELSSSLVSRSFTSQFHALLPSVASKIFQNHSSRCKAIHAGIGQDLGLEVNPLWCEASRHLDAADRRDYARGFDALTLEPLGLRHQVWLDLGKPMTLRPDACSILTLASFKSIVEPIVFGASPEITEQVLEAARKWVDR